MLPVVGLNVLLEFLVKARIDLTETDGPLILYFVDGAYNVCSKQGVFSELESILLCQTVDYLAGCDSSEYDWILVMQLCKTLTFVHVNYKTIHAAIVKELHHNEFTRGILKEILHSSDSSAYNDQVLSELLRPRLLDNKSDVL